VSDASTSAGPGVIVIAEPSIWGLLAGSGVGWRVQDRQESVAQMWGGLSAGALDQRSRVLVFSDSLLADGPDDSAERGQTAGAVVAMAHAGAHVFVTCWRPDQWSAFESMIAEAAAAQQIDAGSLVIHRLTPTEGGAALLDEMRGVLSAEASFPVDYGPVAGVPLSRQAGATAPVEPPVSAPPMPDLAVVDLSALGALEDEDLAPLPPSPPPVEAVEPPVVEVIEVAETPPVVEVTEVVEVPEPPAEPPTIALAPPPAAPSAAPSAGMPGRPSMPPIGGTSESAPAVGASGYPASASLELLERPKRPGQTTITVTSSKGGSGKSTASILLAGSIARASADAGTPLSVCLIDLDTRDGQVASLIGKFMPTALNIRVQPVWDEDRIRRNLVHADGLGIDTLLAPIRPRTADTVGPDFYRTIVRSLQRMYDVVIMDTSVQYLEPLIAEVALGESDEILFVTTLASTAVQGMARALREITAPLDESGLGIPREKIGIIVNQSLANVGMERDQVLAAGLGVPVVGVIPLATKDVLTATNLNRMYALLDHPLLGPAYNELARACLPGRELARWTSTIADAAPTAAVPAGDVPAPHDDSEDTGKRRGLFRR
jgi:cellulose biosynthesis protein BcsQ